MRNLKRALSLVMAMALIVGMMVVSASAVSTKDFTDGDEIRHTEAVNTMVALNVISGKEDGSYFDPNGTLTRAEMAKIISYVMNGGVEPNIGTKLVPTYSDIDGHWAEAYIEYCTSMGIINGDGAGKFNPGGTLTASQAAKMFLTAMGYNAKVFGLVGNDWETNTNRYANEAGLYKELTTVSVSQPISRDDACQMAYNAIQAALMERGWALDQTTGSVTETYELALNTDGTPSRTLFSERFGGKIFVGSFEGTYLSGALAAEGEIEVYGKLTTDDGVTSGETARSASFPSDLDISYVGEEFKVLFRDGTGGQPNRPDKNDTIYGIYNTGATTVYNITKADLQEASATEVSEGRIKFGDRLYEVANLAATNTSGANIYNTTYTAIVNNYGASSVDNDALDGNGSDNDRATAAEFAAYINNPANGLRVRSNDAIKFVCDENGRINRAYVLNSITAKVTALTSTNIQLAGQTSKKLENCIGFEDVVVGDIVRFANLYPTSNSRAVFLEDAQVVEGVVSAFNATGSAVQIDGTWYKVNTHNSFVNSDYTAGALTADNVGDTVSLILDGGKYYGAYDVISGFNNYAMVTWAGSNLGVDTVRALLADGSNSTYQNIGAADGGIALPSLSTSNNATTGAVLYAYDTESNNAKIKLNVPSGYVINDGDAAASGSSNTDTHSYNANNMVLTVVTESGTGVASTQIVSPDAVVFLYDEAAAAWKTYTASDLGSFSMTDGSRLQYIVKGGRVVAIAASVNNAPTAGSSSVLYGYVTDRVDTTVNDSNVVALSIWNGTETDTLYVDGRTVGAYAGDFIQYPVVADGAVVAPSDVKIESNAGSPSTTAGALNFLTTKLKTYDTTNGILITTTEQVGADGVAFGGTDSSFRLPADVQIIGVKTADQAGSTVNAPVKYTELSGSDFCNVVVVYEVNAAGYNEVKAIFVDEDNHIYNYTNGAGAVDGGAAGAAVAVTAATTVTGANGQTGTVTTDKTTAVPGETITYTVTVTGNATAAGKLTMTVGTNSTVVANGATVVSGEATANADGLTVTFDAGKGAGAVITFTVTANGSADVAAATFAFGTTP